VYLSSYIVVVLKNAFKYYHVNLTHEFEVGVDQQNPTFTSCKHFQHSFK
jgi:hypothetical protein